MSAIVPRHGNGGEKNRPPPPSSFSKKANEAEKPRKIRNVTTQADYAELERCYTFVPSSQNTSTWQDRMVKHYHSHLYKEYVLADLRRPGQVGLRWRMQQEVKVGKGHATCGNKHCPSYERSAVPHSSGNALAAYYHHLPVPSTETEEQQLLDQMPYGLGLHDYEVNFAYMEGGVQKNELVKLRLCLRCAPKLFHNKGGALGARRARLAMDQSKDNANENAEPDEKLGADSSHSNTSSSADESVSRKKRRKNRRKGRKNRKREKRAYYSSDSGNDEDAPSGARKSLATDEEAQNEEDNMEPAHLSSSSSDEESVSHKKHRRKSRKKRKRRKKRYTSSGSDNVDEDTSSSEDDLSHSRKNRHRHRNKKERTKSKSGLMNVILTLCAIISLLSLVDASHAPAFQHAIAHKQCTSLFNLARPAETTNAEFLTSNRMPLGQLFENRNYIFSTVRNIRSYEWTEKETEELWDDLTDEALVKENKQDYELQQIVLVPAFWDTDKHGNGDRFDVHDGQQRLVTLALLIAALRDSLSTYPEESDTVEELADMLNPRKPVRKAPVLRIEMRHREGSVLEKILRPEMDETGYHVDIPKQPKDRKILSDTGLRIIINYELLLDKANDLTVVEKLKLVDYLQERVHLLVSVYTESRMARNIVMGQGKGKNNEPIDDLKGLVCYRETYAEEDQNEVFEKWDYLASDESVGRKNMADACLLMASVQLRTKVKKNDDINMMEKWLKQELERNPYDGKQFFHHVIDPSCRTLKEFRDGCFDVVAIQGASHNPTLQRKILMQLMFLRAASLVTTSAVIESAVLYQLLQKPEARVLERQLKQLELTALWMMLTKPSAVKRSRRCFDLLDFLSTQGRYESRNFIDFDEIDQVKDAMDSFEFGKAKQGKLAAAAILERLDAHVLCRRFQSSMPICTNLQLEHILPQNPQGEYWDTHWPDEDMRGKWTHRLGNLALLNQKANAKASNKGFSTKRDHYSGSPYPLTSGLQSVQVWDQKTLEKRHKAILNLANEVWGL